MNYISYAEPSSFSGILTAMGVVVTKMTIIVNIVKAATAIDDFTLSFYCCCLMRYV